MKKVGFYGGKFLPLHLGHVYAIIKASTMVDELYVVLSHSVKRDQQLCEGSKLPYIPSRIRLRWLSQLTKDMEHVKVIEVEDQEGEEDYNWKDGATKIKEAIGKDINVVFSSEMDYDPIFNELYPEATHILIDEKRKQYPISATAIRHKGVFHFWDCIPEVVKPYFIKKVVILGTESCGKSTLTRNLALIFNTTHVREYGRDFCEELGGCDGIMLEEDYPIIAYGHKLKEYEAIKQANKIVFIDTEAAVTQFYSELYNQMHQRVLDEIALIQQYDLYLYLEPDVKWVDDGIRVHGEQKIREENNQRLKGLLKASGIEFVSISGTYQERLEISIKTVRRMFEEI
ncbi:multifunctional transcriptional regulator/nicotinamide-nucleotide adenylyltransferase/ribosylnicotinamide kinase NadR [Neobacillus niacini]|uniref:multifunctional transcriptional regulator/nicotinamide-nucleotide adenylyltransferase/ribosylnicotinamide kinase NadR n=1 Tax=Neobacillus niacini TaxID=86668 RepID=UPI0021CB3CAC|nr:multifunctional transcriptional regulator/nicotinamide-nucleotide adenylyltransferase/ribosylnicotinamide kinase NadR [Neobacillus niacini]MCM3767243.1 multifunctional transcriptional regulator/nicotinamide-nucleotide adenylyltransferase/ribosylnicotinamide kinase NadR [Neobacillus niacini]